MNKQLKLILILTLALITFILPSGVNADIAPPIQPPITNLEPGSETTNVRMLAETVLIEVKPDNNADIDYSGFVTANFTMRNMGSTAENLSVRFPITANDGRGNYPEIYNIKIKVNSTQIPFNRVNYPDIRYQSSDVPWAEFNVSFPIGKDVSIEISYILNGSGYEPFTSFYYILETGAGWFGTIGSADVILRLPYPANPLNVIFDQQIGWSETTKGGVISSNEVRWHFEDFEPGPEGPVQNMEFSLVYPGYWQEVMDQQSYADQHPSDGEAWGRLGMAAKRIFFLGKGYRTDPGGEEIYAISVEAYEKCLELKPQDAQWHAGFADLLANRAYWDSWTYGATSEAKRAIQEINLALNLAPADPIVLNIAENISLLFPESLILTNGKYDFPWLTQTPTPFPTSEFDADPAIISGEYFSEFLTLDNQENMQMVVRLQPDHSAFFEARYEDGQTIQANGDWVDNRDYSIRIDVQDSEGVTYLITFMWDDKGIYAIEFPEIFSGPQSWDLMLSVLSSPTPTPKPSETPNPTLSPSTEPTQSTQAPVNRLCGSSLFAPLGLVGVLFNLLKTPKREEIIHD